MSEDSYYTTAQEYLEQLSALNAGIFEKDLESFIEGNRLFLYALEQEELGNVAEKSLLHLQCRSGLETLSWSRLGARVVGVDFDEYVIKRANSLAQRANLEAKFFRVNIYNMQPILAQTFDIVYTAYGVLFWLDNLEAWASIVAQHLAPGGIFLLIDYHPAANILDEMFDANNAIMPQPRYPYRHEQYQHYSSVMGRPQFEYRNVFIWNYSLSDIINALIKADLHITSLREHEYMFAKRFEQMEQDQQGRWCWSNADYHMPLLFSLQARRLASSTSR